MTSDDLRKEWIKGGADLLQRSYFNSDYVHWLEAEVILLRRQLEERDHTAWEKSE